MKKILLASVFLGSVISSFSQTQIPNGDFESWSTSTYCTGLDSADHFLNAQALLYLNTKKNLGAALCPASLFQYKSTDKQSGNYALILGPQYIDDETFY